jgi:hypothetical protein
MKYIITETQYKRILKEEVDCILIQSPSGSMLVHETITNVEYLTPNTKFSDINWSGGWGNFDIPTENEWKKMIGVDSGQKTVRSFILSGETYTGLFGQDKKKYKDNNGFYFSGYAGYKSKKPYEPPPCAKSNNQEIIIKAPKKQKGDSKPPPPREEVQISQF